MRGVCVVRAVRSTDGSILYAKIADRVLRGGRRLGLVDNAVTQLMIDGVAYGGRQRVEWHSAVLVGAI